MRRRVRQWPLALGVEQTFFGEFFLKQLGGFFDRALAYRPHRYDIDAKTVQRVQPRVAADRQHHAVFQRPGQLVHRAKKLHRGALVLKIKIHPPIFANAKIGQLTGNGNIWIGVLQRLIENSYKLADSKNNLRIHAADLAVTSLFDVRFGDTTNNRAATE